MTISVAPTDTEITVLHVDDDIQFTEMVSTYLEQLNDQLTVLTEQRAKAGLDRLNSTSVDCIISDYQMPEMSGLEFLEAVHNEYPDLPFILFTGKGSEEVAELAINKGVDSYVQKEFGTGKLLVLTQQIITLVEKNQAEKRLAAKERQDETPDTSTRNTTGDPQHERCLTDYETDSVSIAVVRMVAELEDTDSYELTESLYEAIDPEALEAHFSSQTDVRESSVESITFTYNRYTITIYKNDRVVLNK